MRRPGQKLLRFDRKLGARWVAGVDEAGRGSLAGPLVVAGVLLDYGALRDHRVRPLGLLNDSKQCTPADREELFHGVLGCAERIEVRLIPHGDVSAALLAVTERSPVDLLWGIGGTPEGVISAAAVKCLDGQLLGRLWPRDESERAAAREAGYDLERVLTRDDLVSGEDVFFSATGITDGDVLQGVRYPSAGGASTESLVTRSRSGTIRRISATHDRAKLRAIAGARY